MKYRLVIFDSDGTLADSLPWMRSIFNELATEYGFRRVEDGDEDRYRKLEGHTLLRELGLPLWKLPQVLAGMRRRMAACEVPIRMYAGVPEMLERMAGAGPILAVVSSNSAANVKRILGPENVRWITHFLCGASMFGKGAKLRRALRMTAVPPEAAMYIGDEIRDGEAARAAGMAFGAVSWGQHDEPTLRAQNPAEFFRAVEEIAAKLL